MRLNVWAATSAFGDYEMDQAKALAGQFEVGRVSESEAAAPPHADLDLYHLRNSPEYGFIYRAALARPGVVLLHDWNLQSLIFAQALEHGDSASYLRDMRRAHGEAGHFVARQVVRGLAGELWPSLYPLNHPILEASLGVVTLTPGDAERVALGFHDLPALALPSGTAGASLADFLQQIVQDRDRLARSAALRRPAEGSLNARLLDEASAAKHELGLKGLSLGVESLLPGSL